MPEAPERGASGAEPTELLDQAALAQAPRPSRLGEARLPAEPAPIELGTAPTEAAAPGTEPTELLQSGTEPATPSARRRAGSQYRNVTLGMTLGRYELIEELGSGGMAIVYLARDTKLRREVAIKVLLPHMNRRTEVIARFHREARAAASLNHPHILQVYDVGGGTLPASAENGDEPAEPPYIVMEVVRGPSLRDLVKQPEDALLAELVACIGVVMCSALGAAHAAGIIHRDVKPANILVAEGGRLTLTDFGVAHVEDDDASLVTRTGALLGTPAFMAPEQAMGDPLDERSDVYALGATLYQLATGYPPFLGPTTRVLASIVSGELTPPLRRNPAIGPDVARILETMLARDPKDRYQGCAEAAKALGDVARAAGLGKPEDELAAFFADPVGYRAERTRLVAEATLAQARDAVRRRQLPRAMALADRVLVMNADPALQSAALALVDRLGQRRQVARVGAVSGALLVVVAGLAVWLAQRDSGESAAALPGALSEVIDAGALADSARKAAALARVAPEIDAALVAALDTAQFGNSMERAALSPGPASTETSPRRRPTAAERGPDKIAADNPALKQVPGKSSEQAAGPADAGVAKLPERQEVAVTPAIPAEALPPQTATLTFDLRPWCDLSIDGQAHGRAERGRAISVAAGAHTITCTQGPGRPAWRTEVTLRAGETRHITGTVLQPVRVTLAVRRGSIVAIGGKTYQNGAVLDLAPGRYRVAVLQERREVAAEWVTIAAIPACELRDQPAVDCYRP